MHHMVKYLSNKVKEKGASLVEYALLVGLIAVVCIGAVSAAGVNIANIMGGTSFALKGYSIVSSSSPPGPQTGTVPVTFVVAGPGSPGAVVNLAAVGDPSNKYTFTAICVGADDTITYTSQSEFAVVMGALNLMEETINVNVAAYPQEYSCSVVQGKVKGASIGVETINYVNWNTGLSGEAVPYLSTTLPSAPRSITINYQTPWDGGYGEMPDIILTDSPNMGVLDCNGSDTGFRWGQFNDNLITDRFYCDGGSSPAQVAGTSASGDGSDVVAYEEYTLKIEFTGTSTITTVFWGDSTSPGDIAEGPYITSHTRFSDIVNWDHLFIRGDTGGTVNAVRVEINEQDVPVSN